MKIVLDTNLLIAGNYNKQSASFKILKEAEKGKITIIWSEDMKREAEKILSNVKADQKFREFLNEIVFKNENKIENMPEVNAIKEDSADNKFLACARKGKADLIVSNDHHLLDIEEYKGVPILNSVSAENKIFEK